MTKFAFDFPRPREAAATPVWQGDAFCVGDEKRRIVAYDVGATGWTDELTHLHEERDAETHFISVASRSCALGAIRRLNTTKRPVILEIGCGSGHFLRDLVAAFPDADIIGADYTLATLEAVAERVRGIPLLRFDLTQCPLPDASVDVVVTLNVLEHIERDDLALHHIYRILKPGGLMIAEVPAGPGLYDSYDKLLMHYRRYDMTELERLTLAAGFTTLEKSHLGFLLYPAFWLTKKLSRLPRRTPGSGSDADVRARVERSIATTRRWNRLVYRLMDFEGWLRRRVYLPVGIRCLINCRKPAPR